MPVEATMRFATRLNSFLQQGKSLQQTLRAIADVRPGAVVDFNFPEHVNNQEIAAIRRMLEEAGLTCNGAAVRYRESFKNGEFCFGENRTRAIDLARQTVDAIQELGGDTLTIWLSYDGGDYPFQFDFRRAWDIVRKSFDEIAAYAGSMQVSVESKPYDPRSFSVLPTTGHTLHLLNQINRPNLGITLDFCHMLMARENPAFSVVLAGGAGKLFGVHLNDGYGNTDDGLMFGSVNPARAMEFVYFLKQTGFDGTVFFDTFPEREDPRDEFALNVETFELIESRLDEFSQAISRVLESQDGIAAQRLAHAMFFGKGENPRS
ncbi:MAG: sugar phosphate isomerase/epimerase [Spirochaetaceae bacterium]|nr:MAG: sugar phosphate isomerase/epimerase [Spirochaetaceae bacterium]